MVPWILAFIVALPILEIVLFIEIGGFIGIGPTIAIVILAAICGLSMLRVQGITTLFRAQESLRQGRFPIAEAFDGLFLALAGAFLVLPGFFTDVLALILLIPPLRRGIGVFLARRLAASGKVRVHGFDAGSPGRDAGGKNGTPVIDGEFEDLTRDEPPPRDRLR